MRKILNNSIACNEKRHHEIFNIRIQFDEEKIKSLTLINKNKCNRKLMIFATVILKHYKIDEGFRLWFIICERQISINRYLHTIRKKNIIIKFKWVMVKKEKVKVGIDTKYKWNQP